MRPEAALARLPVPLRRAAYRLAHVLIVAWWIVRRPRTAGVKCVIRDGDRALLVRHTYGDRDRWELPGGGLHRGETPLLAARREAREELGLDLAGWSPLGPAVLLRGGRTTLHGFAADWDGTSPALDPGEIAAVRWVPIGAPPRPCGPDVPAFLARAAR